MKKRIAFGENLRKYREKSGLTQEKLAEMLKFSAKSVSKWECGNGLPTAETIVSIAEVFGISTDELLFGDDDIRFLAIDGGASKTEFLLADSDGNTLASVRLGASNPNDIGIETAAEVLRTGIRKVCVGYPYGGICAYAGISGGRTGENFAAVRRVLSDFDFLRFENGSDIDNIVALGENEREVFVIIGTGIICYAKRGGEMKRVAGWGQYFDVGGSGYNLGCDAITAALRESDGSGEPTLISSLLEEKLGEPCAAHLGEFYRGGKRYIAGFAPVLFDAFAAGDGVAAAILERNMRAVADIIRVGYGFSAKRDENINVLFAGGISKKADVIFPVIKKYISDLNVTLAVCGREPVCGALKLAAALHSEKI